MTPPRSPEKPAKEPFSTGHESTGQAIWTGTVSFSLVAIPVQLIKAVEPGRVSFRMLHNKDYSPLSRGMICPKDGKIVPPDEMIRGYEIAPGQYIPITAEELESVSPERSRTIEILEFIRMDEVDPVYFSHPYYLLPSQGGEKAYRLLAAAMHRTGRAGLAKFVFGEREHLVAVKSMGELLCLIILHYTEEIVPENGAATESEAIDATEKSRIKKVIREMTGDFTPDRYADERRANLVKLLKKKLKKRTIVEGPAIEEAEDEGPVDLIAALEESMRTMKRNRG